MNSGRLEKVPENGDNLNFHSSNRLSVTEINESIIKPESAVQLLKENGLNVTNDQAKTIMEFLYKLADIALSQYFPE